MPLTRPIDTMGRYQYSAAIYVRPDQLSGTGHKAARDTPLDWHRESYALSDLPKDLRSVILQSLSPARPSHPHQSEEASPLKEPRTDDNFKRGARSGFDREVAVRSRARHTAERARPAGATS